MFKLSIPCPVFNIFRSAASTLSDTPSEPHRTSADQKALDPAHRSKFFVMNAVLVVLIFTWDLSTPLGWADGFLYLIPLILTFKFAPPRYLAGLAVLCSALIILGWIFSPAGGMPGQVTFNRSLGIAAVWMTAVFLEHRKKVVGALENKIIQRKRMEEVLRESERRIDLMLGATSEGVWDWNIKTGTVYCSPRWIESLGYALEEVPAHVTFWESIVHPDDMPRVKEALKEHWEGRTPVYVCENRLRTKTGSWRWNLDRGKVVEWDADGKPLRMVGTDTDIGERKRAEEALRESEAKFRNLAEHTNDLLWETDRNGAYTYCSPNVTAVCGYEPSEILGKTPFDFMPPDEVRHVGEIFGAIVAAKKPFSLLKHGFRCKDGSLISMECGGVPILDREGQLLGYRGVDRDITERVRAEEVLREQETRFRFIIDHASDAIFYLTLDGTIQWVSRQATVITGRTMAELIGHPIMSLFTPAGAELAERRLAAIRRGESVPPLVEFEVVRPDGSVVWVEANFTSVLEDGKVVGRLLVARDITERKWAEEALRMQARVLESMLEGVSLSDENGVILYTNLAEDAMFGYEPGELIGKHVMVLNAYPPEENARIVEGVIGQLKARGGWEGEFSNRRKDGTPFTTFARITALELQGKKCWVCVQEDITKRRQAEAERRDLYERLQESHKSLRTLSQRLLEAQELERRRIARELHDETGQTLTSLLIGMRALAEMPMRKAVRKRVSELRKTAARAINEIKRLALGLHPSVLDDLGLETALTRLTEEFVHAHGLMVDLHMNGLDGHRLPLAVETTLYRIVQEALTNVAKHAGGARVSVLLQCSPSAAKVIIEDDGRGFDVQTVLKSAGRLNRMGLHGMRERAALLNGSIEIESTPGGGTTIYAQVPIGRGSV